MIELLITLLKVAFWWLLWYNGCQEVWNEKILCKSYFPLNIRNSGVRSAICATCFCNEYTGNAISFATYLGSYILLFIHQRDYYSKSEVEQIQYVNHQAEDSLTTLLEQMPVGVIKLDLSSGEVEWFNPYAELILTNEVGEIDVALIQTIIKASVGIQVLMLPWVRPAIRFIWIRYLGFFISLMCLENTKRLLS